MDKKVKKIKELRKKNFSYERIGQMFKPPITGERVRQILYPEKKYKCPRHKILIEKICFYCQIEYDYSRYLRKIKYTPDKIKEEAKRLSEYNRTKMTTIQRTLFVKHLAKKMTQVEIGKLIHRDHTAVGNLIHKEL